MSCMMAECFPKKSSWCSILQVNASVRGDVWDAFDSSKYTMTHRYVVVN